MITVEQLRKKALRIYPEVLRAAITDENIFPRHLPANKTLPKSFGEMQAALRPIIANSKEQTGYGYTIRYETRNTRSHGSQSLPVALSFESRDDLLHFIGKSAEFKYFCNDVSLIVQAFPQLKEWIASNTRQVIEQQGHWASLLEVCSWFTNHYQPDTFYLRELPISVHTKFIEERKSLISSLLQFLVPEIVRQGEDHFETCFRLRFDEPLLRIRLLDTEMAVAGHLTDLALPYTQLASLPLQPEVAIVSENKMTFLTLPALPRAVGLWGHGYRAGLLRHLPWLLQIPLIYWGDLDVQGFEILSQLRSHFPQTQSILMDRPTFEAFQAFAVPGKPTRNPPPQNLTPYEQEIYEYLRTYTLRLEQERIPHAVVSEALKSVWKFT